MGVPIKLIYFKDKIRQLEQVVKTQQQINKAQTKMFKKIETEFQGILYTLQLNIRSLYHKNHPVL